LERKQLRILLVEDDQIESMKFKRAIVKDALPHELLEAKDGEEALEILKSATELPDILFLDLNMPKINGLEFLQL